MRIMYVVSEKRFENQRLEAILKVFHNYITVILELTIYLVQLNLFGAITPCVPASGRPFSAASRARIPPRGTESKTTFCTTGMQVYPD